MIRTIFTILAILKITTGAMAFDSLTDQKVHENERHCKYSDGSIKIVKSTELCMITTQDPIDHINIKEFIGFSG